MTPQESRRLWCFLDGDPDPYNIDISIDADVKELKFTIAQRIQSLHDKNADRLKLWKLNVVEHIGPDYTLARRLEALGDIATYSKVLSSEEKVGELFPKPHSEKDLHIVVQCPEVILAPSASQKRSRSPEGEVGQEMKRKKVEKASEAQGVLAGRIHGAIKAMPENLDLSDPLTFTALPFPSLLPMSTQRFEQEIINGVGHFKYLGRSQFCEFQQRVESGISLSSSESLYLYGTSGSGKSHLLAAFVYRLIREGKHVFYIPDCSSFYLNPLATFLTALKFAFYGSTNLGTIGEIHTVDAMICFMSNHQDLYIVVDQVNALESERDTELSNKLLRWLNALRCNHKNRYIFSASANEISNRDAEKKQRGISVFGIFGGMNKDETDQWFTRHSHKIPHLLLEQRQRVEYITGRIPLLLRCLFKIPDFVEHKFRAIPDLRNVGLQVHDFFETKFNSLNEMRQKRYLQIMRGCVRGNEVELNNRALYDLRHFYVDDKDIGHYTCGIAFEAMMSILRAYDDVPFLDGFWYTAVSRSDNPIVRGFLAEQICLTYISRNGLSAVDDTKLQGPIRTEKFEGRPDFSDFLGSKETTRLYLPIPYNYRAVDGVILFLNRALHQATVFSIQFTLSDNHKKSDKDYHERMWSIWSEQIISAGFEVQSTFVWIDREPPSKHHVTETITTSRSGDRVIHPEYTVVHVGVEDVNSRLAFLSKRPDPQVVSQIFSELFEFV